MDWGLLGYYLGEIIDDEIPVLTGRYHQPSLIKLKHFGAAAASSGGVEMYHIPGITPEARTVEEAFARQSGVAASCAMAKPSAARPMKISTAPPTATSISSCSAARTTRSIRSG